MNGACAANENSCNGIIATNFTKCSEGLNRCEDGICRSVCPIYDGCPNTKPLKCPNGLCANYFSECSGTSDCPHNTPFRCSNGTCGASFTDCLRGYRTYLSENLVITNSHFETRTHDFITDPMS